MGNKYFLSMLVVVRDENEYLEEWIRYHMEDMGFDHFYIYDNESEVSPKEYLEERNFKFFDRITFEFWKTSGDTKEDTHMHWLKKYGEETQWIFPADPDEYVFIMRKDRYDLVSFLKRCRKYARIVCPWRHFNADGQVKRTPGNDMERFTRDVDWPRFDGFGKYFAQTDVIERFSSCCPITRSCQPAVEVTNDFLVSFFRLNHYFTRSYEEFCRKIARGTDVPFFARSLEDFFVLNPDMGYLYDGRNVFQKYGPPGSVDGGQEMEERG